VNRSPCRFAIKLPAPPTRRSCPRSPSSPWPRSRGRWHRARTAPAAPYGASCACTEYIEMVALKSFGIARECKVGTIANRQSRRSHEGAAVTCKCIQDKLLTLDSPNSLGKSSQMRQRQDREGSPAVARQYPLCVEQSQEEVEMLYHTHTRNRSAQQCFAPRLARSPQSSLRATRNLPRILLRRRSGNRPPPELGMSKLTPNTIIQPEDAFHPPLP
jgi:hypothetical protein